MGIQSKIITIPTHGTHSIRLLVVDNIVRGITMDCDPLAVAVESRLIRDDQKLSSCMRKYCDIKGILNGPTDNLLRRYPMLVPPARYVLRTRQSRGLAGQEGRFEDLRLSAYNNELPGGLLTYLRACRREILRYFSISGPESWRTGFSVRHMCILLITGKAGMEGHLAALYGPKYKSWSVAVPIEKGNDIKIMLVNHLNSISKIDMVNKWRHELSSLTELGQ